MYSLQPLYRTAAVLENSVPVVKMTSVYVIVLFISIGRMPFLAPTLDNADPLFALVFKPSLYLHLEEVTDQESFRTPLEAVDISRQYSWYLK